MNKLTAFFSIALVTILSTSYKPSNHTPVPKLYPELENFFKTVKNIGSISDAHKTTLENLYSYLVGSALGNKEVDVVYTCPDNSFRSVAAQIFTQTLMGVYKYKKVKVFSCGSESGSTSPDLISFLTTSGYKINKRDDGAIEAKYCDELGPIVVKSIKADDPSLPKTNFMQISLCSAEESCPSLQGAAFNYPLDFKNPKNLDKPGEEFTQIAKEIYYSSRKAYDSYH